MQQEYEVVGSCVQFFCFLGSVRLPKQLIQSRQILQKTSCRPFFSSESLFASFWASVLASTGLLVSEKKNNGLCCISAH